MSVAVIGGKGFFGSQVVRFFNARGMSVASAGRSRSADVVVDLTRPDTLAALDPFDVVVNCSDSLSAPVTELVARRAARGGLLVESSADLHLIERAIRRWSSVPRTSSGSILLGMGIAPGLSNLLAAASIRDQVPPARLDVALRVSSFCGGGQGMCGLMAAALTHDTVFFEGGERRTEAAVSHQRDIPFPDGRRQGLRVSLPESVMLHHSTKASTISTYLVPKPQIAGHAARSLATMADPSWAWGLTKVLTLQRSRLLRRVAGDMEVVVVADGRARSLKCVDGVATGAAAIVAAVELLLATPPRDGLVLPDQCLKLDDVLAGVHRLGCKVTVCEVAAPQPQANA